VIALDAGLNLRAHPPPMWHTHQLIWVLHGCHCKSGLPLPIVLLFPGRREPAIRLERNAVRPTADRV